MLNWMLLPFHRYWEISGRSRRKEYWLFTLFLCITNFILVMIEEALQLKFYGMGILTLVCSLVTLVPGLTVSVRRLHDLNISGWWLLMPSLSFLAALLYLPMQQYIPSIVPIIFITLFVISTIAIVILATIEGNEGSNRFGADPKAN